MHLLDEMRHRVLSSNRKFIIVHHTSFNSSISLSFHFSFRPGRGENIQFLGSGPAPALQITLQITFWIGQFKCFEPESKSSFFKKQWIHSEDTDMEYPTVRPAATNLLCLGSRANSSSQSQRNPPTGTKRTWKLTNV